MRRNRTARGFTLMECLVLIAVLAIVGAAAGRMLQAAPKAAAAGETTLRKGNVVMESLEALRARPFSDLANVAAGTSSANTYYYDVNGNATTISGAWKYRVDWSALTGSGLQLDASTTGDSNIVKVTATLTGLNTPSGTQAQTGPAMSTYVSNW